MDDSEIIALFYARSEQAIAALEKKYGAVCSKVANNILNNRQDAEECVNDAYLAVWNTVPPQRPDPLLSYVARIVRNLSLKKYRANTAKKRNGAYDVALDEIAACIPAAGSVEDELAAREAAAMVNTFLATLDAESRVLFVRRYWYADSIEDLAALFHRSRHYISVRLSRLRAALRTYLQREGVSL